MSSRKAGSGVFVSRFALLLLSVLAISQSLFSPLARAQQGLGASAVHLGIIVTATAQAAADVHQQLAAGMNFFVLAKEKSIDPTASSDGYLGKMDPAGLRPELRDALAGLKAGQFSSVIHIPTGFAVLEILPEPPKTDDYNSDAYKALVASGVIRVGAEVDGLIESDQSLFASPKPDGWNLDLSHLCDYKQQSLALAIRSLHGYIARLAPADEGEDFALKLMQSHSLLAQIYGYVGDMDNAVTEWKSAYQVAQSSVPDALPNLEESLGAAYLHKSEMENGVYHKPGDLCLFPPPDPGSHYDNQDDSKLAIQFLLKYLQGKPDDLEVRWLLNLAYETLGQYPARVPAQYLIPASSFKSSEDIGRFVDVAKAAGLDLFQGAGGVIVDDFDNDGLLDIVVSSVDLCDHLHFFHNNGDGTFSDRSAQAGFLNQPGAINLVGADYNNDGYMDILALRGGWEFPARMSLLRNNGDGTFTDVTGQAGLGEPLQTQTAAWADIDNDGYLDLFVGNEKGPCHLFHNKGDGTFEDISHSAHVDQVAFTKGIAAADYDNDGYPDFYCSNMNGVNFLYHNNHDLTFTEVGREAGVQAPWASFPTWFFDYDNDGWPDLFVASYVSSEGESVRSLMGLSPNAETLKLYRNRHDGTFEDVTAKVGLNKVFMPMGSNFGDIDNDGFLDVYLGNGGPSMTSIVPHVLLRNENGKTFVDITASSGTGEMHKGHAIAFADLHRAGHNDIVSVVGGAIPADKHCMMVYENPGNKNDWIDVRLVGVKTNRCAIGAQVKVTVENDGRQREIYRTVGANSSFGGNPKELLIGLGRAARIVSLDVSWPTTKSRQHFAAIDKNQYIEIKEFAKEYTKLVRHPFPLGAAGGKTSNAGQAAAPDR